MARCSPRSHPPATANSPKPLAPTDPSASLTFLRSLHARLPHPHPAPTPSDPSPTPPPRPAAEAYALSLTSIAYAQLVLQDPAGSKASLDEADKVLARLDSVEASVNAGLYGVSADYYKVRGA